MGIRFDLLGKTQGGISSKDRGVKGRGDFESGGAWERRRKSKGKGGGGEGLSRTCRFQLGQFLLGKRVGVEHADFGGGGRGTKREGVRKT